MSQENVKMLFKTPVTVERVLAPGWVGRLAYGVTALLAPSSTIRALLGRDHPVAQDTAYINRVLGVRDIVLAGATVVACQKKRGVGAVVAANLVSETGDLAALLLEIRDRGGVDATMRVAIGMNVTGFGTYLTAAFLLNRGAGLRE